ncbi:MAG: hypothetical protein RLZZ630_2269 [Bacteroidota bacterium]
MISARIPLLTDFIRKNQFRILLGILVALAGSFITVLLPLSLGNLQSIGDSGEGAKSRLLESLGLRVHEMDSFFVLFLALVVIRFLAGGMEYFLSSRIGAAWTRSLRDYLFERQIAQSPEQFRKKDSGYYLLRFSGDMGTAKSLISKGIIKASADAGLILFTLLVFLMMDVWLAFTVAIILGLGVPLGILLGGETNRRKTAAGNSKSLLIKTVSEAYARFITIKALNFENKEKKRFMEISEEVQQKENQTSMVDSVEKSFSETYFFLLIAIVVFFLFGNNESALDQADLLTVILLLLYVRGPIRRLLTLPKIWKNGTVSLEKIWTIGEQPVESTERDTSMKREARAITYLLKPNTSTRRVPDFRADKGRTCILLGGQGSGKSYLLQKLLCLVPTDPGETLLLDIIPYNTLSPFEIRRQIGYSSDEIELSGESLVDALNFNNEEGKMDKAVGVLNKLGFEPNRIVDPTYLKEIRQVPHELSSGQIQLLRLARTILTGKKVLCLDEPFSNLDSEHTRMVVSYLNGLKGSHTIIIASASIPAGLIAEKTIELK